jgi:hypothetical protein
MALLEVAVRLTTVAIRARRLTHRGVGSPVAACA